LKIVIKKRKITFSNHRQDNFWKRKILKVNLRF
jgi:hypothetical protein